jgi:hypothetical protein
MFDFESLTLGEVATIEDLSGQPIGAIADEDAPKGKALAAIVMVIKRRTGHPGFKFNEALNIPLKEANALLGVQDESEPLPFEELELVEDEGKDEASE